MLPQRETVEQAEEQRFMRAAGLPDTLTVINGPEDGTEFALTQREFLIGSDNACSVNLRLDRDIEAVHGRASAVADGYRVRSAGETPVYVNGKVASIVRSQIVRAGDVLRVGHTELVLECSADGLASRNRGITLENDFMWALRRGALRAGGIARLLTRLGARAVGTLLRGRISTLFIGCFLLYWLVPGFRDWVWAMWNRIVGIF